MHVQCVLLHKIYYANLSECTHKHILNVHRNVYFTRIRIHYVRTIKCVPVQQTIENMHFAREDISSTQTFRTPPKKFYYCDKIQFDCKCCEKKLKLKHQQYRET